MGMVSIEGYQMEYPPINLETLKTNKRSFDMLLLVAHIEEAKKGFKIKKIGKTTKKGTKITYTKIKNEEEFNEYKKQLKDLVNKFNEDYGTNYTL